MWAELGRYQKSDMWHQEISYLARLRSPLGSFFTGPPQFPPLGARPDIRGVGRFYIHKGGRRVIFRASKVGDFQLFLVVLGPVNELASLRAQRIARGQRQK